MFDVNNNVDYDDKVFFLTVATSQIAKRKKNIFS